MAVGVPGGYRWVSWRSRYSPELVAILLPTVWEREPWLSRERPVDRCISGAGTCTHTCDEDQFAEGCVVDGDHKDCKHRHGGHRQCGKCTCIDPRFRRMTSTRDSDMDAMRLDVGVAWQRAAVSWEIAQAMMLRHRDGLTQEEIAEVQGVSRQAVSLRLRAGHMALADFLNGA